LAGKPEPLDADALYQSCDLAQFDFETTKDLEPIDRPLGQERALEAIEFGVDIDQQGFNLFLIGDPGLGKNELIRQILARCAAREDARCDWCYVNNFTDPQKPRLLRLPPGMGEKLRRDMESLVEDLLTSLPSSFQSDEYRNRRQEIEQELQDRQDQAFAKLDREAEENGIVIMRTPGGYTMGPAVDGRPLNPQEYAKLAQDEQQRIEKIIAELQLQLQQIIRDMPLLQREHHQRIKALNQEVTQNTVEQLIAWMENSYRDQPAIMEYLQAVKDNAIYHLADALIRIRNHDFPVSLNEVTRMFFERTADLGGEFEDAMRGVLQDPPDPAAVAQLSSTPMFNSRLRTTCVATQLDGGHAENALPQRARATVNCRVLPGESIDAVEETLRTVIGNDDVSITRNAVATPSPPSPLTPEVLGAIEAVTEEMWPGVPVVPTMSTGATDGLFLRNAGIPVYGVSGIFGDMDEPARAHGQNERILAKSYFDGQEFLYRLTKTLTTEDVK